MPLPHPALFRLSASSAHIRQALSDTQYPSHEAPLSEWPDTDGQYSTAGESDRQTALSKPPMPLPSWYFSMCGTAPADCLPGQTPYNHASLRKSRWMRSSSTSHRTFAQRPPPALRSSPAARSRYPQAYRSRYRPEACFPTHGCPPQGECCPRQPVQP